MGNDHQQQQQQSNGTYSEFIFPGVRSVEHTINNPSPLQGKPKLEPSLAREVSSVHLTDHGNYYLVPSSLDPEKDKDVISIVAISDTHGEHMEIANSFKMPSADILIHCGDFSNNGRLKSIQEYNEWIGALIHEQHKYKYAILIAGNHDVTLDTDFYLKTGHKWGKKQNLKQCRLYTKDKHSVYLQDSTVELFGLTFYGSPFQPAFGEWAFQLPRGKELRKKWTQIPEKGVDVLLTHGPPKYHGDLVADGGHNGGDHVGCTELLNRVHAIGNIKYHVFGHVHEGYGVTKHDGIDTVFINASSVNQDYEIENKPIMFYLPGKRT